mmetsp:Transcript_92046/g.148649  ORF Transcript_92046/g.148649 Transcript_92046/m.148649 type:complete len:318 (+) Transcript_92046:444-1397(+)
MSRGGTKLSRGAGRSNPLLASGGKSSRCSKALRISTSTRTDACGATSTRYSSKLMPCRCCGRSNTASCKCLSDRFLMSGDCCEWCESWRDSTRKVCDRMRTNHGSRSSTHTETDNEGCSFLISSTRVPSKPACFAGRPPDATTRRAVTTLAPSPTLKEAASKTAHRIVTSRPEVWWLPRSYDTRVPCLPPSCRRTSGRLEWSAGRDTFVWSGGRDTFKAIVRCSCQSLPMCTCTQEADAKGHLVTHCNALGVSPCALVSRNMEDSENMAFAPFATRSASLPIGHAPGLSTTVAVCTRRSCSASLLHVPEAGTPPSHS